MVSLEELQEGEKEEAEIANLEQELEDVKNDLFVKSGYVLSLERDINTVEKRLSRASEEQAVATAEVQRLKRDLISVETSNTGLKRRLEALGGGVRNGYGLSSGGLSVETSNTGLKRRLEALGGGVRNGYGLSSGGLHLTNLDLINCSVSISNKTNMDVSLDGWTVRIISDKSLFTTDGLQQQIDGAVMVRSPHREGSRRDSFVRQRHAFVFPFDFMLAAGSDAVIRWGPEVTDYGDLNQFHWERPQDFDASDVVVITSENEAANGGGGGLTDQSSNNNSVDPDKGLREGALCLVDPNGVVSFTLPLLSNEDALGGVDDEPLSTKQKTSSNLISYGNDHPLDQNKNKQETNHPMNWVASPAFSPGAQAATENLWTTTQKAVLATPRRLGNRFAEAVQHQSSRRWANDRNPETPIAEPNIPESCCIM
eukprot:CAMPEP_0114374056 /NCGR_PEP_ID=MMETSP0101-20121206/35317_1 /TAXON_ID=38822 ORGANISM="Pteridomonas danica, Strain PT" /NCGR_SAMPLE_ID=MMETSP0101 /ASSEMBLY_ACC=CAM_ASM_000211 /LENGTH=425 /DNA_ID=CAMNT_0001527581 /DNA_START=27 /DNA_END=1304 /DNA_ORIENTATION=-